MAVTCSKFIQQERFFFDKASKRVARLFSLHSRRPGGSLPPPWNPASLSLCSALAASSGSACVSRRMGLPVSSAMTSPASIHVRINESSCTPRRRRGPSARLFSGAILNGLRPARAGSKASGEACAPCVEAAGAACNAGLTRPFAPHCRCRFSGSP